MKDVLQKVGVFQWGKVFYFVSSRTPVDTMLLTQHYGADKFLLKYFSSCSLFFFVAQADCYS